MYVTNTQVVYLMERKFELALKEDYTTLHALIEYGITTTPPPVRARMAYV